MSSSRVMVVVTALVLGGCYRDFVIAPTPGRDAGIVLHDAAVPSDAGPLAIDSGWREPAAACAEPTGVDLLFVVDNSNSMAEEQASLATQLPELIRALLDPPDDDGDGMPDWLPVPDLQVAVITTDMGVGGATVPTCHSGTFGTDFGDDGVLRTRGRSELPGCEATYPPVFDFAPDDLSLIDQLACVSSAGTGGCGFEQQLEATLKALSPSAPTAYTTTDYESPTFFRGTLGHGDRENRGFVRDDTLLAIVIVTDEEDCSAADPDLFDPTSPFYSGTDLNLRCFRYPGAVHPVQRYVTGLTALRARRPDLLAFALIAGIPPETAVDLPGAGDFQAILENPLMEEVVDETMPTRLRPSCNVAGLGVAFPPRRLVQVAAALGEGRATVQSICQPDFTPAMSPILRLVARRACAMREVTPPL